MKRLGILVLVLGLVLFSGKVYADNTLTLAKTYAVTNNGNNSSTTYVATTTIIPGYHRILSYTIVPVDGSTLGAFAALYDATSTTASSKGLNTSNLLGESETVVNEARDRYFPFPKSVSDGLAIIAGPKTTVIVEYTR